MENSTMHAPQAAAASKAVANNVATSHEAKPDISMPETKEFLRSNLLGDRSTTDLLSENLAVSSSYAVDDKRQNLMPFAERKKTGNLPDGIQSKMENAFGQDFSDVEVIKNSPMAENLAAIALTQGNTIHVAPGYDPYSSSGQEFLGHELTHVVQQKQGRVSSTHFEGGLGVNDSAQLEAEADKHGQLAAKGESVPRGVDLASPGHAIQKKSAVIQMWRPLPGQARVESTQPDIDGAWRAVASAISQVAGGFAGGVTSELRSALIGRISEELAGGLGTITINNFKTYSGPNMTWRGDIQFRIDGVREISGGGVGSTVMGAGGATTTGSSVTDTQAGGTTGGATVSSSPGSGGGTGGSVTAGVSSSSTNAQGSSASHVRNSTTSTTVSQVMRRYIASMACFVSLSAETSFGDSGWDYINPFAWPSGAAVAFVDSIGELNGSASTNCGTVTFYEGSGMAP